MKIIHICMCDAYAEHWSYHRNISSIQNAIDGHDVYVLTSSYTMDENGLSLYVGEETYKNAYGVKVKRLPKAILHNTYLQSKFRLVKGLYQEIIKIHPDLIMIHNPQFLSLSDVIRYKKEHPETVLIGDSHADYVVSARNIISKYFLGKFVYGNLMKRYIGFFDKFYFISDETKQFFIEMYTSNIPENMVIPLGSRYYPPDEKMMIRARIRNELNIPEGTMLLLHTGKLDARKKTEMLLNTFYEQNTLNAVLVICGSIPENMTRLLYPLIERDDRVLFLGWKKSEEICEYLCAADIYMQPGMHSVTLQTSLSCGTPALVSADAGYESYYLGWEIVIQGQDDLREVLQNLKKCKYNLDFMSNEAYKCASRHFDSRIFANEMYKIVEEIRRKRTETNDGYKRYENC